MKNFHLKFVLPLFIGTLFFACEKDEGPGCDTTYLGFNNALNYQITVEVPGIGKKEVTPFYGVTFDVKPNESYTYIVYRTSDGAKLLEDTARSKDCRKSAIYDIKNN
jgi:hypothetical protein